MGIKMGPRESEDTVAQDSRFPHSGGGEKTNRKSVSAVEESNGKNKGKKRQHEDMECTDSCDCEEFGQPLSKRINQMNIEYENQNQNLGHSSQTAGELPPEFLHKYPFPKDSFYYSRNFLLSQLYDERIRRNPQLKHNPS